ncbi:MAG: molybdopterin converting factor subunit 1 [Gammaproteobacteria bacterium]|nr:molybdopterin converting factor subunit 1 [Gammaproteobacteria bacterium]MBL6999847.1 molybdopterin converting factor subunit 1 [Gammaproteobacteria bacterium]
MARLLYFASLREQINTDQEQLELPQDVTSVHLLKGLLAQRGGRWNEAFSASTALLVSVNQQMANEQSKIQNADEIAFFPPVTGG